MNTKQRIAKLEGARPATVEADNRQFIHRIGADGVTYFIDGVEVDAAKWAHECKAYDQSHAGEDQQIKVTVLGLDAIQEDGDA